MNMLEKLGLGDFDEVFEILKISFPESERRNYDGQKALFQNPLYTAYGVRDRSESKICAVITVWDFDVASFVEHFAVDPSKRGTGIGSKMINELSETLGKPLCLEVELPDTEIACRRIEFYKRNGLFLNEYPYVQPPLTKGCSSVPMYIMTSGAAVDEKKFELIRDTLYKNVYNCSINGIDVTKC